MSWNDRRGDEAGLQASSLTVRFRAASPADADFTFDIFRDAFRFYIEQEGAWDEGIEYRRHTDRFGRLRHRIIVADDVDAGYVATAARQQPEASYPAGLYLLQLMIRPMFQSRGIGKVCLELLVAEAEKMGMPLRFRVLKVNPRALAFYESAGFAIVGESATHFSMEQRP